MACSLAQGVKVRFLESDAILHVLDLNTRNNNRRYNHAKLTVTKEAGQHLAEVARHNEPVVVSIGDSIEGRYLYSDDSLEIERNNAQFTLYDQLKILDRGVISQQFDEIEVGDVVAYIFNNREDPHDVLTGWDSVTPDLLEQEKQDSEEDIAEAIGGTNSDASRDGWKGVVNDGVGEAARWVGILGKSKGMPYNKFRGIEFDDISPNEALAKLGDMFSFTSWVDRNGKLWIGQPESVPTQRHAVSGLTDDKTYAMKEYNVTSGSAKATLVRLNGETGWYGGNMDGTFGAEPADRLYPIAEAWVEDENGDVAEGVTIAPDEPSPIWELSSLEDAARNRLVRESMNYKNGNIIFNGAASENKQELAQMEVGDVIMVADYIENSCNEAVDGGSFIVTEVQHRVSARNGWKVTVQVGSVPDNIETFGVYYNASDDESYLSLESYKNNR
jgi:hypothetical protein